MALAAAGCIRNAETCRFLPSDFVLKTHLTQRYGEKFIPQDCTIQDWSVTYDELEPHYDQFEYLSRTSGTAGNLKGQVQEGGNPFEKGRGHGPTLPRRGLNPGLNPSAMRCSARQRPSLAISPFRSPPATCPRLIPNPWGVKLGPCTYCGFCEWFGCGNYSKASPQTTVLPALILKKNFKAFDNSEVTRINVDGSGKRATGVKFVDTSGEEWEQPADLVILSAYCIFNIQLLLLLHSGIGKPYNPVRNEGVIGAKLYPSDHLGRGRLLRQGQIRL